MARKAHNNQLTKTHQSATAPQSTAGPVYRQDRHTACKSLPAPRPGEARDPSVFDIVQTTIKSPCHRNDKPKPLQQPLGFQR